MARRLPTRANTTRLAFTLCGHYRAGMSRRTPKRPAKSWRVLIIRRRGEYLGSVEAPDRERAEAVAVKVFDLDREQRGRLLILQRPGEREWN